MIGKLACNAARKFIKNPDCCYDQFEIYQYGFFILFSNLIFFILTIILGAVLDVFSQSIVFFVAFFSIRQYAGGYHAATETRCEILSTLSILLCLVVVRLSKIYDFRTVLLFVSVVSAICIFVICPLDTPEKPLSKKEVKYFRKISWLILLVISIAVVVSYFVQLQWIKIIFVPCGLSLTLECILLFAGKLKRLVA